MSHEILAMGGNLAAIGILAASEPSIAKVRSEVLMRCDHTNSPNIHTNSPNIEAEKLFIRTAVSSAIEELPVKYGVTLEIVENMTTLRPYTEHNGRRRGVSETIPYERKIIKRILLEMERGRNALLLADT